jgi:2-polyprenyl-6-methoxyphenol hydroxylase-like FAD-dependent oxidoreductase
MQKADVLIVGGSLGGLMAANLLLRAGLDVLVLEKSSAPLDGRGAGIVTHSRLIEILERCGMTIDDTLGVEVGSRVVLDVNGAEVARSTYSQILTSWTRLYSSLLGAFSSSRYILNANLTLIENGADEVTVTCADGRRFQAPILIGADGIRSTVRSFVAPQTKPVYAGYVAWRGICDEASLSDRTLESLFGYFGFGLPDHEQMLGYPVAGPGNDTRKGKRCYNFVWYRPAVGQVLNQLMTDADGRAYGNEVGAGIPPHKIHWKEVAAVRLAAQNLLAPQFAEVLQKTAQPFFQPIFDLTSPKIAFGNIGLLGDAAFVARPHVGMGVTKAAEDAAALLDAIRDHGVNAQALQAYEYARVSACNAVVERGRILGAYMEAATAVVRSAQRVMEDTAIDLALLD